MNGKHSPLPWAFADYGCIQDSAGEEIAFCWFQQYEGAVANAQLIVRAVNNEQRYREALEDARKALAACYSAFSNSKSSLELHTYVAMLKIDAALSTEGGE